MLCVRVSMIVKGTWSVPLESVALQIQQWRQTKVRSLSQLSCVDQGSTQNAQTLSAVPVRGFCGVGLDHCSPGKCDPMWGTCPIAPAPQPGSNSQMDPKTIVGIVSGILVGIGAIFAMSYTGWKWWHKHKAQRIYKRASTRARSQGLPAPSPPLGVPRVKDVTPGGRLWSWLRSHGVQHDAKPAASAVGQPPSVTDKTTGDQQNLVTEDNV